jgi:MATE family multidrug resistance protein
MGQGSSFRPNRRDLSQVVGLALPVVGVQLGLMAMGLVDTMMVGRVSAPDLAAVALGNLFFFTIAVFGVGVLLSLDPVVAQAVGAGEAEAAARGLQRGLIIAVALAMITSLALLPASLVFRLAGQPDDVIPIAVGYVLASIPGTAPFFFFVVLRQSLQAMGRVAPILWTAIAGNVLNFGLNWILIWGNLGAPRMGALGSAWATSIARWFLAVTLLAVAWPLLQPLLRPWRSGVGRLQPLVRMLILGIPIGFQYQLEWGAFAVIGLLMGLLGTEEMAGHQIALNLAAFAFMIPMGIGAAAAVRVGQEVGRNDAGGARRAAGAALSLGVAFMLGTALLFLGLPTVLARAFTDEPGVIGVAATLLPIAGVFQVSDGLQAVAAGVLRGVGDTRAPMWANILGFWVLGLPLSWLLGFRLGLGPTGLWWGLALGLAVLACLLLLRVRSRLGRAMSRVQID